MCFVSDFSPVRSIIRASDLTSVVHLQIAAQCRTASHVPVSVRPRVSFSSLINLCLSVAALGSLTMEMISYREADSC